MRAGGLGGSWGVARGLRSPHKETSPVTLGRTGNRATGRYPPTAACNDLLTPQHGITTGAVNCNSESMNACDYDAPSTPI